MACTVTISAKSSSSSHASLASVDQGDALILLAEGLEEDSRDGVSRLVPTSTWRRDDAIRKMPAREHARTCRGPGRNPERPAQWMASRERWAIILAEGRFYGADGGGQSAAGTAGLWNVRAMARKSKGIEFSSV